MIIPFEALYRVEKSLDKLIEESKVICSFVTDKSGQVIAACGDLNQQDLPTLAVLLAGTYASNHEVARFLKEKDFLSSFFKGNQLSIFTELVSNHWLLIAIFNKRTHIGNLRALAHQTSNELEEVLISLKKSQPPIQFPSFKFFGDDDDNAAGSLARIPR